MSRARASIAIVASIAFTVSARGAVRDIAPAPPPIRASDRTASTTSVALLRPSLDGMIAIAGGTFTQGSSTDEMRAAFQLCKREPLPRLCDHLVRELVDEGPPRQVTLSPFFIDRTEVTVAAYRRCVRAGACEKPGFAEGDARFDRDDLPVTHVAWDDARSFCAFRRARLPTEAEWERAARGISGRNFPWGAVSDGRLANHGALDVGVREDDYGQLVGVTDDGDDEFATLAPVGSFASGATPDGLHDLAGNAAEWVADVFDDAYAMGPVTNPTGAVAGARRVVRGGGFLSPMALVRGAARSGRPAAARDADLGFRCAASSQGD